MRNNSEVEMSFRKKVTLAVAIVLVLFVLALGAAYTIHHDGGLDSAAKAAGCGSERHAGGLYARAFLNRRRNYRIRWRPTMPPAPDVSAGLELYKQKCETCHGYDGSGKTEAGGGLVSTAPRSSRSGGQECDGWGSVLLHPERHTEHRHARLANAGSRHLAAGRFHSKSAKGCLTLGPHTGRSRGFPLSASYVGSASCKTCHSQIYERWQKTLMANVVRDPREHPDAIIPDLSKPDPLVTFSKDDIAFVYGSKWKQRYFKKVGDDFFPLPAQWDVTHKIWRAYNVKPGTDWWTPYYPADNMHRPTGPTCDGCHSVNYDVTTKKVTEWNVGCEKCHGPGSEHVKQPSPANIVNPASLNYVDATNTCIQCHSQGQRLVPPSVGNAYDWPVGFHMGKRLDDFWKLEDHKLGETTFTHFADGTAHKNRMQGNDFVTSLMYARGVSCFSCHDAHGTENNALLAEAGQCSMPRLSRPDLAERPSRADDRATHPSQSGQPGQRVHRLPHAEDPTDDRRRERAEPHVSVRHSGNDLTL